MRVFTGVQYPCGLKQAASVDVTQARVQPLARLVFPREADDLRAAAERRDVVRGIPGAAGQNLRRVVLKDEDRRLARHTRDAAVDELVGNQIADDRHAARRKRVEQVEKARYHNGVRPSFSCYVKSSLSLR